MALRKKLAGNIREKKMINLNKATSVGILYEMKDVDTYYMIHDYIGKLQKMKTQVKALGYSKNDQITKQFLPILSFDFIYGKQINWYGKPRAKCAEDFMLTEFDICINIASSKIYPLKYISASSKAKLKAGPYSKEDEAIYDIMIHPQKKHDQKEFLSNIHEYLTLLNPKENV